MVLIKSPKRKKIHRTALQATAQLEPVGLPILICAHNGFDYIQGGYDFLKNGGDTLDAALRVVKGPEDDPNDTA